MEEATKKIQRIFRHRRVFTEPSGIRSDLRFSKTSIVSTISRVKISVNFDEIFDKAPIGFSEVVGRQDLRQKPHVRYTKNNGWIGTVSSPKYVTAKRGSMSVTLTKDEITVSGAGNYEEAWRLCVQNKWVPKILLSLKPEYKTINVKFNLNAYVGLDALATEIDKRVPESMFTERVVYSFDPSNPATFPSLVLKIKSPKVTFQVFENGTITCSGLKKLEDLEVPKHLFVNMCERYLKPVLNVLFDQGKLTRLPGRNSATGVMKKLAQRYPSAGTWNQLMTPPPGYYIRPGTNGQPRMYVHQYFKKLQGGPTIMGNKVDLTAVAPKVVKAFREVGKPIPESTRAVFRNAGHPLEKYEQVTAIKKDPAEKNRRAPTWNAVDPAGEKYVRPGPGQQPYFFKIPKDIAKGRLTVIKAYTEASRNIPTEVRKIFKIAANVKTNVAGAPVHEIAMGLDRVLRINGHKATKLTKEQLSRIARNMNIPEVNKSMNPTEIIERIRIKAGVAELPFRKFDVEVNGTQYLFRNDYSVQKTKGTQRTTREWKLLPDAERNRIAKAFLPQEYHTGYNAYTNLKNKYDILRAYKAGHVKSMSASSSSSLTNFAMNLEQSMKK